MKKINEMDEQKPSQTQMEETVPPPLPAISDTSAEPDEASIREMLAQCFEAAEAGDAEMQFFAAELCQEGFHCLQSDNAAVTWLLKSAIQGNVDACRKLAEYYIEGRGVVRSIPEAVTWLEKAAQISDDPKDAFVLGLVYLYGERFGDFSNEIVNRNESTDAFMALSLTSISQERLEMALPSLEKAALNSNDPNFCLIVALAHAFGVNVIAFWEVIADIAITDASASALGKFVSDFEDPQVAIGLASRSNRMPEMMFIIGFLAMFDAVISGEPSLNAAFDRSFADRFCNYIVERGGDIGQLPFHVKTVEKWLSLAQVKGDSSWNAARDLLALFSSESLIDVKAKIVKKLETDTEEEPLWNLDFDAIHENERSSDKDLRYEDLKNAVVDRLNAEARKGDELTEQLLSYLYFSMIRKDEPTSVNVIARYLPNADDENEAFLKMMQWVERKQDPELHDIYHVVFKTYVAQKIDDPAIFDAWIHYELGEPTDRGRRAYEILRQRAHYGKTSPSQVKNADALATDTRYLEIELAAACREPSSLVGLILGDTPPRPLLGVTLLAELESRSRFINLIRTEIEHLEAMVIEAPNLTTKLTTKGMRYVPATPVMAAVLLALMDETSTPEAARRLTFAHEKGDITATYLMSRQTGQSLEAKGHLLRSVLEAIDVLMTKRKTYPSMTSGKEFPDYLGNIYELLWRRANDDLNVVKDQEQACAREEERRQMISFLSHTLTSATAGGAKTVRKIASKLASAQANIDLPDVAQHLAAQVSRMARVESLVEVFKLYTSDDKALREGWNRDTGGEFSVLQVCAMAVQQALLRFYFSSEHEADFSRLLPDADYATVSQEFMTEVLALDMSTQEQALQFIAWTEQRLPFLRLSFAGAESAHLAQGGARDIVIFSLTCEFLGNALKYAAAGQAINLDISAGPQGLEIICRNAMKAVSVAPIYGGKTGLTFIRRVCTLINAEFDEPTVKDNVFILRALLPIQ